MIKILVSLLLLAALLGSSALADAEAPTSFVVSVESPIVLPHAESPWPDTIVRPTYGGTELLRAEVMQAIPEQVCDQDLWVGTIAAGGLLASGLAAQSGQHLALDNEPTDGESSPSLVARFREAPENASLNAIEQTISNDDLQNNITGDMNPLLGGPYAGLGVSHAARVDSAFASLNMLRETADDGAVALCDRLTGAAEYMVGW